MAEPLSLAASAIIIARTAAHLSLVLFKVAHTFKHALKEIEDIALEISIISNTFIVLSDTIGSIESLCKPALFQEIHTTLTRYHKIEAELIELSKNSSKLKCLRWFFNGPRAKSLLKRAEGIKSALTLIVSVLRLTHEQVIIELSMHVEELKGQQPQRKPNRYRTVIECAVEAARNTIKRVEIQYKKFPTERRRNFNHKSQVWETNSHDTATWLYSLVFSPDGSSTRPFPASNKSKLLEDRKARVDDYDSDDPNRNLFTVKSEGGGSRELDGCRDLIVWDGTTETSSVIDRLLRTWTELDEQQVKAARAYGNPEKEEQFMEQFMERIRQYECTKDSHISGPKNRMERTHSRAHISYWESDTDEDEYESSSSSEYASAAEETKVDELPAQGSARPGTSHHEDPEARQDQGHVCLGSQNLSSVLRPRPPNSFDPNFRLAPHGQIFFERSDAITNLEAEKANNVIGEQIILAKEAKQEVGKALSFAQEQAAQRKRSEYEERLLNEQKKSEEAHMNKMEAFGQRLDTITSKLEELGHYKRMNTPPLPLRKTCILEGGRRIEVSEFVPEMLEPSTMSERGHQSASIDVSMALDYALSRKPADSRSRSYESSQHGRLQGSYGSLPNSNSLKRTEDAMPSQKIILLSSKLDRSSTKTSEMTSLLARSGITFRFEDTSCEANRALTHLDYSSEDLVRSTVIWESPIVPLGSELFRTLKFRNWRPFYSRSSEFGMTYFLGRQPIQVFFFDPKYRPQLTASTSESGSELIHIAQELIEKDALLELGLHAVETYGEYHLNGQLTADDVENLINRSFTIRETRLRRQYRHLPRIPHNGPTIQSTGVSNTRAYVAARRPSTSSAVTKGTEEESEASLSQTAGRMPLSRAFRDEELMLSYDEYETAFTSSVLGSPEQDSLSDLWSNDSSMYETGKRMEIKSQRTKNSTSTTSGRMNNGLLRLRPTKVKSHVD